MAATVILFLAANPETTSRLALDEEARGIEHELRMARFRDEFAVRALWAPRPLDLLRGLNDERPAIVHFSGHGLASKGLVLPDDGGGQVVITGDALRQLFEGFPRTVRLVVLNACFSHEQCDQIKDVIGCAIGMTDAVEDLAARRFAAALYAALGAGCSVKSAFDQAVALVHIYRTGAAGAAAPAQRPGHVVPADRRPAALPTAMPVLRCRAEVDPDRIAFVAARTAGGDVPPEPDGAAVVRAARRALNGVDEGERQAAVVLLASTDGDDARAVLVEALGHPVKSVRIAAARQFPDQGDPRVLPGWIEGLAEDERRDTPQWNQATWSFRAAVRAAGAAAVPALIAALDDAATQPEPLVMELAAALGGSGDHRATPALVALTSHADPWVRVTAIDGLAELGDASAAPPLHSLLDDDHDDVRGHAAVGLGRLGDTAVAPRLRGLLRRDVRGVRVAAAGALAQLRDAEAVPELAAALADPVSEVRIAAARALIALDQPAGADHLRAMLAAQDGSTSISADDLAALLALIPVGDPEAMAMIERRIVKFRSGNMPDELLQALAARGAAGEAVLIRILDQVDPSRTAAQAAAKALAQIESPEAAAALTRWRLRR